ncbi:hypothetical protein PHYBOEH_010694 [Phytophthora boehmeriae]|uniref:Bzip transcription factor n=1 Tax=Phytophthora boehmeriae TaxID=109152 RepID=A0A8T1WYH2_9STRA|nr:hypothetical protein PHYBOEH_010694 [Phytophthora boehmeriae]
MLEETVQKLHLEIPELELQRNQLVYGDQQRNWTAVVEYFHTFRFGIPMTPEGQLTLTSRQEETDMSEQLSLLRSTIAPDVILGELRGVESLVEQWRRYSSYFEDLHFQLGSIQRASDTLLTVVASLGVTVSDATLSSVFPHLLDQGEDITDKDVKAMATATSIGTKLLGQRLLLPCSICFEWDAASCRVVRLETTLNLVAPLIRVLGNVVDAAAALEHALIRPDGGIGQIKGGQMWTPVDNCS